MPSQSCNPSITHLTIEDIPAAIRDLVLDQGMFDEEGKLAPSVYEKGLLAALTSQYVAITGISTGDEGKGRTIPDLADLLVDPFTGKQLLQAVIKINGGANSGHTAEGLKLNLIPAGVTNKDIPYIGLGRGVVADPRKLSWELKPLQEAGYHVEQRLRIDSRTMVSLVTDRLLDLANEHYREQRTGIARGSTGRGITPAYTAETGQNQIYYSAFLGDLDAFRKQVIERVDFARAMIEYVYKVDSYTFDRFFERLTQAEVRANSEHLDLFPDSEFRFERFTGGNPFTIKVDEIVDAYWAAGRAVADNICSISDLAQTVVAGGGYVVGEFGQAYWLDKRHGFSPNVTASHTYTPEMAQSLNIPASAKIHTIGVAKAYDTKVGTHLFLTQIPEDHPLSTILCKLEFGTSTGRQRMVGWYDAVEKSHVLRRGGYEDIVINKLDALTHQGEWSGQLQVCVAYRSPKGDLYHQVPDDDALRHTLTPVYKYFDGWDEDISQVSSFQDLPVNAQKYVAGIYAAVIEAAQRNYDGEVPLPNLRFVGVGPDRSQIISDVPSGRELLRLARVL